MRTDLVDKIHEVDGRPDGTSRRAAIRRLGKHRSDLVEDARRPWTAIPATLAPGRP
jgi:hypothetical protein